jgi:hypothetical protein
MGVRFGLEQVSAFVGIRIECLVDDQIKLADYSLNLAADVSIMSEKLQELVAWLGNNIVFVRTPTQKDNGGNIVNAAVVAS